MRRRRSRYRKKERGCTRAPAPAPARRGGDRGGERNREERESESRGAATPLTPLFHPLAMYWRRERAEGVAAARRARGAAVAGDGGKEGGWQRRMPVGPSPRYESGNPRILSHPLSSGQSRGINPPFRERRTRTECGKSGGRSRCFFLSFSRVGLSLEETVPDIAVITIDRQSLVFPAPVFTRPRGREARDRRPSRTRDRANESRRFLLVDIDEVVLWQLEPRRRSRCRADIAPR